MRHLYLDIFSGLSGDMLVGALLDLGVEFKTLERELRRLPLSGYHLHSSRKTKSGIEGVKFDVHVDGEHCDSATSQGGAAISEEEHDHDHGHAHKHEHEHDHQHPHGHTPGEAHAPSRNHSAIRELIANSSLSPWVRERALAVFSRIAIAEGKIHGVPSDQVHFHEVGGVDSIVDIVGSCIGLELLGCPEVTAGPVVEGTGFVKCAHGLFPIPSAATLEILGARGIPISQCTEPHELVTPTGAALLAEFATRIEPMRTIVGAKVGYGLGTRDNHTRPNVVRAILWDSTELPSENDWEKDTVTVLETNLDDVSGEILGHVVEKALRLGALDAFHTPVQMKKQRPGVILTLLCSLQDADQLTELLLRETTAFGVRRTQAERRKLQRAFAEVKTEFGVVKMKTGTLNGEIVQAAPEFESARSVAAMAGVPVKAVMEAAVRAYYIQNRGA